MQRRAANMVVLQKRRIHLRFAGNVIAGLIFAEAVVGVIMWRWPLRGEDAAADVVNALYGLFVGYVLGQTLMKVRLGGRLSIVLVPCLALLGLCGTLINVGSQLVWRLASPQLFAANSGPTPFLVAIGFIYPILGIGVGNMVGRRCLRHEGESAAHARPTLRTIERLGSVGFLTTAGMVPVAFIFGLWWEQAGGALGVVRLCQVPAVGAQAILLTYLCNRTELSLGVGMLLSIMGIALWLPFPSGPTTVWLLQAVSLLGIGLAASLHGHTGTQRNVRVHPNSVKTG